MLGNASNIDSCEVLSQRIDQIEEKLNRLNDTDPDMIPLHFLFADEAKSELKKIADLLYVKKSENGCYAYLVNQTNVLLQKANLLHYSLKEKKEVIETIFFQNAEHELLMENRVQAIYLLERALEYQSIYPDALILRAHLALEDNDFNYSVELLDVLYNRCEVNAAQEEKAMILSAKFYKKVYETGDSLIKSDHAAEALELFQFLEDFCHNMPTNYCNDDYYHGILKSQKGIYESYLAIATIAGKRGMKDVETQFLEYAQEYLDDHQELTAKLEDEQLYFPPEMKIEPRAEFAETSTATLPEVSQNDGQEVGLKEAENAPVLLDESIELLPMEDPRKIEIAEVGEIAAAELPVPKKDERVVPTHEFPKMEEEMALKDSLSEICNEQSKPKQVVSTKKDDQKSAEKVSASVVKKSGNVVVVKKSGSSYKPTSKVVTKVVSAQTVPATKKIESETSQTAIADTVSIESLQKRYHKIVDKALVLCINGDTEESLKLFLQAEKLEKQYAIQPDFRVAIMLGELKKLHE